MARVLLLCFVHGFKGSDDTFHTFPEDLKRIVSKQLPEHRVESVVYPKYETKGELSQATEAFLAWLQDQVMDVRKAHMEAPWPPKDRSVGVILVAHSMGGFIAADTLFLAMDNRASNQENQGPIFPLIQGVLAFDTPYNGLARSMFAYGAFSNYSKVSNVFNVMTALSAAVPASLGPLTARRAAAGGAATSAGRSSNPGWKVWQLAAVRTGTVGAIAAGGVAAYTHREAISRGMRSVKNLNRDSVVEGYRQGMGAIGQGLAYINRGNVGRSFAWLSDHFTFVGALMKQGQLNRRLERLGTLQGVGIHVNYCSLGENGYWSGGYFVPERTFCAVPTGEDVAHPPFTRCVIEGAEDEVQAHMGMFRPDKNDRYEDMTEQAGKLVITWFLSDADVVDDPRFRDPSPEEAAEDSTINDVLEKGETETNPSSAPGDGTTKTPSAELPDESPIDIAAAASLVPLPDDTQGELLGDASNDAGDSEEKKTYMNHLFQVAQQAGVGVKNLWPQNMPSLPASVSSIGQVSMPSVNIFSKKQPTTESGDGGKETGKEIEAETKQS